MRVVQNPQMQLGELDLSQIKFNLKSRDDIPKILRGLQFLYMDMPLRKKIFALLEKRFAPTVDKGNGRPGMPLWSAFVCGTVRLDLNIDYDRLLELTNEHMTLRAVLGHGEYDRSLYHFQTLKDNVSRLTPELLDEVNQLIVDAGHVLVKKKDGEALRGRCDSFVVGVSRTQAKACDAVLKMGAGLPKSACRSWFQTARCCCVQKAWW